MSERKILVVEDSQTDALLVKHALRKEYGVDHVRSPEEARASLQDGKYVAVVTDYRLPGTSGMELLRWICDRGMDVPVIVMSGQGDERVAAEALKLGAYDYIVKSEESLASLPVAIQHAVHRHQLEQRAQMLQQIVENASDAIITMEEDGRILTANRAVTPVSGYAPDEIVGQPITELFPRDVAGNDTPAMLAAGAAGNSWQGDLFARRKDGSLLPVHMSTSVLRGRAGQALCLIGIARDIAERQQLLEKLKRLTITDNLTGLFNHRFFQDRLHYEFMRARRYGQLLGCIMMDVDYFKAVNDTHGHLAGDDALKSLACTVTQAARSVDIVARYGGEEFAVLLPNTDLAGARRCAENIWEAIGTSEIQSREGPLRLTVSVGVTALTPDVENAQELHRRADAALLLAKRRGRNNVCVWDEVSFDGDRTEPELEGNDLEQMRRSLRRLIVPAKARYLEAVRDLLDSLFKHTPKLKRHSANVTIYTTELGRLLHMSPEEEEALHRAALFHDIGHVFTPAEILNKPGPLTPEQMEKVKEHVVAGTALLGEMHLLELELQYIGHHHERFDGQGYPDGLMGKEIPLGARILAIADAYDAMTSGRPYRKALAEEEVRQELLRNAGAQFDPQLVKLFLAARQPATVR